MQQFGSRPTARDVWIELHKGAELLAPPSPKGKEDEVMTPPSVAKVFDPTDYVVSELLAPVARITLNRRLHSDLTNKCSCSACS